jgi:predicted HAD superfamily hydrolase
LNNLVKEVTTQCNKAYDWGRKETMRITETLDSVLKDQVNSYESYGLCDHILRTNRKETN